MISIVDKRSTDRACGTCTKCCDGWLSGSAYGYDFSPGKPCHFSNRGGCGIYPVRPEDPCKTFLCHWIENNRIPEWMIPVKSGIIILVRYLENQRYLRLIYAGKVPSQEVLDWAEEYSKTGINLVGFENSGARIFSIDKKFKQAAAKEFSLKP